MHIPFSAPDIPELDALPDSERTRLMLSYTTSASAKRLIRLVQVSMLLSLVLLLLAINSGGTWRLLCGAAVPISFVSGVVAYRIGATRALRRLLNGAFHFKADDNAAA
jgi:hypothetical protein